MLDDFSMVTQVCFVVVFFVDAGLKAVGLASAYRKESLCHTSKDSG